MLNQFKKKMLRLTDHSSCPSQVLFTYIEMCLTPLNIQQMSRNPPKMP
jgi:hypothetical protein